MLSKQFIQDYFNADYKGIDSLLSEVLIPIFQDYEEGYTEITVQTDKAKDMAKAAHIKTIKHVATLGGLAFDIKVFDVTLDDDSRIHKSRKKIQELVRKFVDRFEGAFIVFHYEDPKDRSWRLSYLEKRESNAASTNAKRYTYLCGQQYPCRTLADRFYKLQAEELTAVNLEDAFSVETLSNEFFDEYRYFYQDLVNYVKNEGNLIDGFVEYADGDKELAEKYARDYIKKLMGRLVFIQFLQNKAWLNNDIHYTHTLFNNCSEKQKENFLDNVLEPLFFGVFNTPKQEREAYFRSQRWDMKLYEQWKDFPYLNGGLFECDELDQLSLPLPDYFFSNPEKKDHVRTPNDEYYSDACGIFDFFDRYNFTIDESDPLDREVGVDPEMLGKIFENLLEDNKDKGAFYTPKEIVQYMCKEALVAYLVDEARSKSEVNKQRQENFEEAIRAFVTDPEMTVTRMQRYGDQQLKDLDESLRSVKICDPAIGSGAFPMGLLNLLMSCRVALNNALRKGQPRAWLKKEIIQNNIYGVDIEKGAIDIARLRFWLSIVVDLDEPEALPNFDYKFMQGNSLLEQYNGVDLSQVADVQEKNNVGGYQISMFESELDVCRKNLHDKLNEYFTVTNHIKKQSLRDEISELVQQELDEQHINVDLSDIDIAANTHFFLWHTWFADVFNRPNKQGFDIVIGNPPYISIQGMTTWMKTTYKANYKFFFHRYDMFACFIELGLNLLRKGGSLSFIQPSVFLNSKSFMYCRKHIVNNCSILLLDLLKDGVFNSAVVPTMIMTVQNSPATEQHKILCSQNGIEEKYRIKQSAFKDTEANVFNLSLDEATDNFIKKTAENCVMLGSIAQVANGINTGDLSNFLLSEPSGDCFPVMKGASIEKWVYQYKNLYLRNKMDDFVSCGDLNTLKPIEKLIMKRIGIVPNVAYDSTGIACLHTIHTIRVHDKDFSTKYVMALMNSKLMGKVFRMRVPLKGDVFPEFRVFDLNQQIPIKIASSSQQQPIIDLVDTILAKKKADPAADTSAEERAIDKLVYSLYGLTEDEINLVEGA